LSYLFKDNKNIFLVLLFSISTCLGGLFYLGFFRSSLKVLISLIIWFFFLYSYSFSSPTFFLITQTSAFLLYLGVLLFTLFKFYKSRSFKKTKINSWWSCFIGLTLFLFILGMFSDNIRESKNSWKVPTGALEPTVLAGDFIYAHRIMNNSIKRGDLVIFWHSQNSTGERIAYVMRVMGKAGDKVKVKNGIVEINGKKTLKEELKDSDCNKIPRSKKYENIVFRCYKESINGKEFLIQVNPEIQNNYYETIVPHGHYLLLGDNRSYSFDSRYWGHVPEKSIFLKASFIWFNLNTEKIRHQFGKLL